MSVLKRRGEDLHQVQGSTFQVHEWEKKLLRVIRRKKGEAKENIE